MFYFLWLKSGRFFVDLMFSVGLKCLYSDRYDVCETHVNNNFFPAYGYTFVFLSVYKGRLHTSFPGRQRGRHIIDVNGCT